MGEGKVYGQARSLDLKWKQSILQCKKGLETVINIINLNAEQLV